MANKITFKTQFTAKIDRNRFRAPAGEHIELRHNPVIKTNGRRELIKDKKVAIYDLIQSHKDECEIENIIRRAVEGDFQILQARHGQFLDITGCPNSIAEAQQFIMNSKEEFEKLPKSIKAKFEFNPELYIAEMSNDIESWLEKTGLKDKYKVQKENEEAAAITEKNFQKAMENLATGTVVNNVEVEKNE